MQNCRLDTRRMQFRLIEVGTFFKEKYFLETLKTQWKTMETFSKLWNPLCKKYYKAVITIGRCFAVYCECSRTLCGKKSSANCKKNPYFFFTTCDKVQKTAWQSSDCEKGPKIFGIFGILGFFGRVRIFWAS